MQLYSAPPAGARATQARRQRHHGRVSAVLGAPSVSACSTVPLALCPAPLARTPQLLASATAMHDGRVMLANVSRPAVAARAAAVAEHQFPSTAPELVPGMRVVIAGAGISGLTLALGLLKKGIKVQVLERDLTAVRGEGKLRGPIQVQSNALAALQAIDPEVAEEVMSHGCITGDRINGLCDGVSGDWYVKFDTFHPAVDRGLPVTRVISRITLQEVLADAVLRYGGQDAIQGGSHVVAYEEFKDATGRPQVAAILQDGRRVEGDVLVGTDGIWSKIRKQLLGDDPAHYSEYTCYTGISEYVPADIDLVGYRVFLGNGQYFVSSDVGEGRMQWYAFHKEPAGGKDVPGGRKARLLELFGHWNYNVVDLIKATPEADVLRRDIYDRAPVFKWAQGRVALLGDSAHAMQPNLGQGGCMAIEDAFELVNDLVSVAEQAAAKGLGPEGVAVESCLQHYQNQRIMRVSAIHGMAGMAAFMASTYKAYLGEGLGPLSFITDYHIPHPGRVVGQAILKVTMPAVLGWVLGGNTHHVEARRAPHCMLGDKPRHFQESEFQLFMRDDDALAERADADWLLVAERVVRSAAATVDAVLGGGGGRALAAAQAAPVMALSVVPDEQQAPARGATLTATAVATAPKEPVVQGFIDHFASGSDLELDTRVFGLPPFEYKGAYLNLAPKDGSARPTTVIGSVPKAAPGHVLVEGQGVLPLHARVEQVAPGRYVLHDMGGTWVNGLRMEKGASRALHPGDVLEFGAHPAREVFRVKLQHKSYRSDDLLRGNMYQQINQGAMMSVP